MELHGWPSGSGMELHGWLTGSGMELNGWLMVSGMQLHVALHFRPAWQTCLTPFDQL